MPDVREAPERKRARRLHQTCLSRGVPADREAQKPSQSREKSGSRSEGTQRKPHPKERLYTAKFKSVEKAARVHDTEIHESSEHVKESSVRK